MQACAPRRCRAHELRSRSRGIRGEFHPKSFTDRAKQIWSKKQGQHRLTGVNAEAAN